MVVIGVVAIKAESTVAVRWPMIWARVSDDYCTSSIDISSDISVYIYIGTVVDVDPVITTCPVIAFYIRNARIVVSTVIGPNIVISISLIAKIVIGPVSVIGIISLLEVSGSGG